MIITEQLHTFSVEFEPQDWRTFGRDLNNYIKSLPKDLRHFDFTSKKWIVAKRLEYLRTVQSYLPLEHREDDYDISEFLSQFEPQPLPESLY